MQGDDRDRRVTLVTDSIQPPIPSSKSSSTAACLVVIYGDQIGRRIPLDARPLECGRGVQCDVPLDDEAVSRRHARIAWGGNGYVLGDLGSTNGTRVNDVPIKERLLRDGDRVTIGHTIFKFLHGSNVEVSYHEEIYRLMTMDGLTQVHNKRSFDEALDREVSRSKRYVRPLSLVLFDIDHFKVINDRHGHLAGDAVLRQFAALASQNVRREDLLARVGGEEFALLGPEVPLDQAVRLAEKLRQLVEQHAFRTDDATLAVTSSFGVVALDPTAATTASELYQLADARLYAAKDAGRNRTVSS